MKMPTTIQISDNIKLALDRMKMIERETYNEVIGRMIEDDMELSEKTKKELEEKKKSKDFVSHEEVKKRIGL
ncbi:hypothetical protein HYT26_03390 [Candidatus Pacearchaeota archaeon]|nr:hypothetical protein [Candidatus Pacearchaeota archaeon]